MRAPTVARNLADIIQSSGKSTHMSGPEYPELRPSVLKRYTPSSRTGGTRPHACSVSPLPRKPSAAILNRCQIAAPRPRSRPHGVKAIRHITFVETPYRTWPCTRSLRMDTLVPSALQAMERINPRLLPVLAQTKDPALPSGRTCCGEREDNARPPQTPRIDGDTDR